MICIIAVIPIVIAKPARSPRVQPVISNKNLSILRLSLADVGDAGLGLLSGDDNYSATSGTN